VDAVALREIPFQINSADLMSRLHLREGTALVGELRRLIDEAQALGKPKALYGAAFIDSKDTDRVVVEGITFTSRVLRVNLEQAHRVFPFLATCGMELEDWANSVGDMLQRFWAETIKEAALRSARSALLDHIVQTYRLGRTSAMNPGSLEDWPIQQQRPLFTLLGDTQASIGVRLTDSLLMVPTKTVSGMVFPTEGSFESCQLCPREQCPGRRAPYDPALYDSKYRQGESD